VNLAGFDANPLVLEKMNPMGVAQHLTKNGYKVPCSFLSAKQKEPSKGRFDWYPDQKEVF